MANKRICDRCGKDVGLKTINLIVFFGPDFLDVDLCDDCEKELRKWLENKEEKCQCNKSVLEVLDQLEKAEKTICTLNDENNHLKQENEFLKSSAVEKLLKKCHIKVEFDIESEEQ